MALSRLALPLAPSVGSDADDTAKRIRAIEALGICISPERMIREYEQPECFKTYASEKDPSVTTNCNVLIALLHAEKPTINRPQIQKIVLFLCGQWRKAVGPPIDKWVRLKDKCLWQTRLTPNRTPLLTTP